MITVNNLIKSKVMKFSRNSRKLKALINVDKDLMRQGDSTVRNHILIELTIRNIMTSKSS